MCSISYENQNIFKIDIPFFILYVNLFHGVLVLGPPESESRGSNGYLDEGSTDKRNGWPSRSMSLGVVET